MGNEITTTLTLGMTFSLLESWANKASKQFVKQGKKGKSELASIAKGYHIARIIIRNAHHAHNLNALVAADGLARPPPPLSSPPADRLAVHLDV